MNLYLKMHSCYFSLSLSSGSHVAIDNVYISPTIQIYRISANSGSVCQAREMIAGQAKQNECDQNKLVQHLFRQFFIFIGCVLE